MIDNELIHRVLNVKVAEKIECRNVGYIAENIPELITFIDNMKWIDALGRNQNVKAVFAAEKLSRHIENMPITVITVDDPRFCYFKLFNFVVKNSYQRIETKIDPSAQIHPTAHIAEHNVIIGKNVIVHPHATIYPDVEIGDHAMIGASVVIGQHGYEYKKTQKGFLSVFHAGKVLIGKNVDVRANTCIDKGLFTHRNTIVADDTKINTLVMIGHGVQIGHRCLIHTCASISGSSTIGDDVWVSPNAVLKNGTVVGDNALIGLGAVVIRNVEANTIVAGNPARFLRNRE